MDSPIEASGEYVHLLVFITQDAVYTRSSRSIRWSTHMFLSLEMSLRTFITEMHLGESRNERF